MPNPFDWHVTEEEALPDFQESLAHGRHPRFWLIALLILLLIMGGWGLARYRLNRIQAELQAQVQAVLDLEQTALHNGDGDLFFSVQTADPAWFSTQLRPESQSRVRTGLHVTQVQQVGEYIWANVVWEEAEEQVASGEWQVASGQVASGQVASGQVASGQVASGKWQVASTCNLQPATCNLQPAPHLLTSSSPHPLNLSPYQQIMFFQWQDGRLLHVPTDPNYWGRNVRLVTDWGHLNYQEVDQVWAEEIAAFVGQVIAETCAVECLADRRPLTVSLTADWGETAVPNQLSIPSPRLVALASDGQPAELFWQELRRRLQNQLTPATIRFAIPPQPQQWMDYDTAASDFMAANPHITVELVELDTAEPSPAELLAYDGAAFPLSESILASGGVVDLTDFARNDPAFDQADFYEQIWQGAWWHGRMWFVPHAAAMNVLYYDKAAYRDAEYPEPSLRWTWEEMRQDMLIVSSPYSEKRPSWGFIEAGNDALFSYAYNWENDCTEVATVRCERPLAETAVIATLEWYAQMAGQPGLMPNRTEIPARERENLLMNWQSARRRAVIWVDTPMNYEFRLLLAPLGVVPFPGSNRFDGITPLRVQGHFISQQAENPQAVWEWLKFLSFRPPTPTFRHVPARPSVAEAARYWQILPRELSNTMRIAFPFARPITLEEQRYFTEEQVTAVLSGVDVGTAVDLTPPLTWFQSP
jgi:ABC-type glycerol-3-phosphate transport system substrate-binding protein